MKIIKLDDTVINTDNKDHAAVISGLKIAGGNWYFDGNNIVEGTMIYEAKDGKKMELKGQTDFLVVKNSFWETNRMDVELHGNIIREKSSEILKIGNNLNNTLSDIMKELEDYKKEISNKISDVEEKNNLNIDGVNSEIEALKIKSDEFLSNMGSLKSEIEDIKLLLKDFIEDEEYIASKSIGFFGVVGAFLFTIFILGLAIIGACYYFKIGIFNGGWV